MTHKRELSIEPKNGKWNVYEWSIHPTSSVLAGLDRKVWQDDFDTPQEAARAFPDAVLYQSFVEPPQLSSQPPSGYYGGDGGFYDAGEYWSEDDY